MSSESTSPTGGGLEKSGILLSDSSETSSSLSGFTIASSSQEFLLHLPARKRAKESRDKHAQEVQVKVQNYGFSRYFSVTVEAASATMDFKGEDRHVVYYAGVNEGAAQERDLKPNAFFGVFDGHDGSLAAEYCAEGLLPHILIETDKAPPNKHKSVKLSKEKVSSWKSYFEPIYCRAFEKAHKQYSTETGNPPSLYGALRKQSSTSAAAIPSSPRTSKKFWKHSPLAEQACSGLSAKKRKRRGFLFFKSPKSNVKKFEEGTAARAGGTTACTLSIYSNVLHDGPFAIVANCGDSRMVTDDGRGNTFRQLTKDHRLKENDVEDDEFIRLKAWEKLGKAVILGRRIYPGGLAVTRSIGDAAYSSAVIPTPDVFAIDLLSEGDEQESPRQQRTHRFIIATDGLWDSLNLITPKSTDLLSELACRQREDGSTIDPKEAAMNLMKVCLRDIGCVDDITILVVDVTV